MKNTIIVAVIVASILANGYALLLDWGKPFPQPIITIRGEHTQTLRALTLRELQRRLTYVSDRGWKSRTAPSIMVPYVAVIIYRPMIEVDGVIYSDTPIEQLLIDWEAADRIILGSLSGDEIENLPAIRELGVTPPDRLDTMLPDEVTL